MDLNRTFNIDSQFDYDNLNDTKNKTTSVPLKNIYNLALMAFKLPNSNINSSVPNYLDALKKYLSENPDNKEYKLYDVLGESSMGISIIMQFINLLIVKKQQEAHGVNKENQLKYEAALKEIDKILEFNQEQMKISKIIK